MKDHWMWLLSDIVAWDSFWHEPHHYLFSDIGAMTAGHFPCSGKYIFSQLQTCSADCSEGSCSYNISSNF